MKILQDDLDRFPTDEFITSDEWDHMRYMIFEELRACDVKGAVDPEHLPFFALFRGTIKDKLIEAGFSEKIIEDERELENLIHIINFEQGRPFKNHSWDLHPPYGFPPGTYKISENKLLMWINPDIEAALLTLESLTTLKRLLVNDNIIRDKPTVNIEAVRVYLRTFEMAINLIRSGGIVSLALAEAEKKEKSRETRELKKLVMRSFIDNIFNQKPHRPKTLGEVWKAFRAGKGAIHLNTNGKYYIAETGKVKGRDSVIVRGYIKIPEKAVNGRDIFKDGLDPIVYAKRSLQTFIDQVKKEPIKVTQ